MDEIKENIARGLYEIAYRNRDTLLEMFTDFPELSDKKAI